MQESFFVNLLFFVAPYQYKLLMHPNMELLTIVESTEQTLDYYMRQNWNTNALLISKHNTLHKDSELSLHCSREDALQKKMNMFFAVCAGFVEYYSKR